MRILLIVLTAIFFLSSKIPQEEFLDNNQKLFATAKIWGFLKYYHPKVAKGKFDWDKQLLEILPSIEQATTKEELSAIYLRWIESLGKVKLCKSCDNSEDTTHSFNKNFDLGWMENDKFFTNQLSDKLKYIEKNRNSGKHHYVAIKGRPPTLTLTNEKSYPDFLWTNKPLRLLSFFRYWNTIEYFYPHKYQIDTDWDEVFFQMLPKFYSPTSETDYHLAMLELVVTIDDSHGYFTTDLTENFFGNKQIPAAFTIIENKVIITYLYDDSLANLNDIRVGDIITKIDDQPVEQIISKNLKYIYGANSGTKTRYSFRKILHGSTDSVNVEIIRNGQKDVRTLLRYSFDQFKLSAHAREPWKLMDHNIGYINLGEIGEKDLIEALEELTNTQSIVLDLRGYPKEFYGYILRSFFGSRNTVLAKQINTDLSYPGKFISSDQTYRLVDSKYKGQVILIVNDRTQSMAEYTALWIQNGYNVTTIGSQTSGAGGIMIPVEFIGGYKSYFTSSGVFYPNMKPIQREGVKIDIEVTPTIEGIINGSDEPLEKAIELAVR